MEVGTEVKDGNAKLELHAESKKADIYEMQAGYEELEPAELPTREATGAELAPTANEIARKPLAT